jgi:hypothetical protein
MQIAYQEFEQQIQRNKTLTVMKQKLRKGKLRTTPGPAKSLAAVPVITKIPA